MLAADVNLLVLVERDARHLQQHLVERSSFGLRKIRDVAGSEGVFADAGGG